jgi:hypothetical protein
MQKSYSNRQKVHINHIVINKSFTLGEGSFRLLVIASNQCELAQF